MSSEDIEHMGSKVGSAGEEDAPVKAPEEPKKDFIAKFDSDGWLRMEVHVVAAASDADKFYIMRGWLDSIRDQAIGMVHQIRARAESDRKKLVDLNNKQGHRGFLNGLLRR